MGKLTGKVALITGGNSGIGLASAKLFAREGAKIVITGRDEKSLAEAQKALGPDALVIKADVSRLNEIDEMFKKINQSVGKLDILFANAGVAFFKPLSQVDEQFFDSMMDVNVKGLYFTIQKSLSTLNDGASIILTGSSIDIKGRPGSSVYGATKAAVRSIARGFSADLLDRNIRVNVLSPGPIDTPIFEKMTTSIEAHLATIEAFKKNVPLKRLGTPEEIAKVALFLAGDDSSFLLGAEIYADGGVSQL
ncbi:MAG: SDR family oxidoreductase [Bdellovibrionales bacterium]|nr:SDR family oxidoreductase [Bdellovibrionales bacterium]